MELSCYCRGACPPGAVNSTCRARPGGWCFAVAMETYDASANTLAPDTTYGCLQPHETGYMQCQGTLGDHAVPTSIACCRTNSWCNQHLTPVYVPSPSLTNTSLQYNNGSMIVALAVSATVLMFSLVAFIVLIYLRCHGRGVKCGKRAAVSAANGTNLTSDGSDSVCVSAALLADATPSAGRCRNYETSSASGSGKPLLCQRTVAREVALCQCVGRGRYGLVYRAVYQGLPVAVKVFYTLEEASWRREKFIFETCRLQHPNILGFMAADITSRADGGATCTEMWLITEYHERGSLYDWLSHEQSTLSDTQTLQMALSIVQGLDYLHQEVVSTCVRPGIAHRDLKSKNILVKADGQCCLADFGLAVIGSQPSVPAAAAAAAAAAGGGGGYSLLQPSAGATTAATTTSRVTATSSAITGVTSRATDDGQVCLWLNQTASRQGTRRYMPPELLAPQSVWSADGVASGGTAGVSFQTLKQGDIYALALVMWELCLRCATPVVSNTDTAAAAADGSNAAAADGSNAAAADGSNAAAAADVTECDQYRVPYSEYVDTDPSLAQMFECVCVRQLRPPLSPRWKSNPITSCLSRLMQECWRASAESRLSTMYIKKRLLAIAGL